jgi:hypothetical protein
MAVPPQESDLETLIQRKLAVRRHQNFADVVKLIRTHNLNESFLPRLSPSVQREFLECLEEIRRDEEWEERTDRQMEEMMRQKDTGTTPPEREMPYSGN